jgi:U3 small nucleolar RNA-associated protein 4
MGAWCAVTHVVQFHCVEESSRLADNPLTSSPVDFMMRPTGEKWVYVGGKRTHTHDVRALTVAFPINNEGILL